MACGDYFIPHFRFEALDQAHGQKHLGEIMALTWGLVFMPKEMARDKRASCGLTCSAGLVYIS